MEKIKNTFQFKQILQNIEFIKNAFNIELEINIKEQQETSKTPKKQQSNEQKTEDL